MTCLLYFWAVSLIPPVLQFLHVLGAGRDHFGIAVRHACSSATRLHWARVLALVGAAATNLQHRPYPDVNAWQDDQPGPSTRNR